MIGIVGAGAFGTALAVAHGLQGRNTLLLARDATAAHSLNQTRTCEKLPGVLLPKEIVATSDVQDLAACDTILLAVPMQALRLVVAQHRHILDGKHLVACCKGIDLQTLKGPTAVIQEICPTAAAMVLTGPSFAADIARNLSTALTLAGSDAKATAKAQVALAVPSLRIYRNHDPLGAELGGALKNVIAIASGACIGMGLGESARAAVMTRGFAELRRFAEHLGAQSETLMGLSGFGDLVLTCTSEQSRNYRYGLALGRGEAFDPSITVEGVATARAAQQIAQSRGIEMPITQMLVDIFDRTASIKDAIKSLLSRPLKEE